MIRAALLALALAPLAACGFTPVAEASGALDLIPGSLWAGWKLFL